MEKGLKEVIAERVRRSNNKLLATFHDMQSKIRDQPKDIERLCEIRDFMSNIPLELEGLQKEIFVCMGIYDILDNFMY